MSDVERDDNTSSTSNAKTIEEIGEFWDTHSLADHWDETSETTFEVRVNRRRRVSIEPDVYARTETVAHLRGVSVETLINLWVAEKLRKNKKPNNRVQRTAGSAAG